MMSITCLRLGKRAVAILFERLARSGYGRVGIVEDTVTATAGNCRSGVATAPGYRPHFGEDLSDNAANDVFVKLHDSGFRW